MIVTVRLFGCELLSVSVAGPDRTPPDETVPDQPEPERFGFWGGSGGIQERAWPDHEPINSTN